MRQLLVLRPEPGASATVKRARKLGLKPVSSPLFEVEAVAWDAPEIGAFDGLLLTSANAVRCAGPELEKVRGLQVFAVGEATAEEARGAGFDIAATGDAGVDRLLGSIDPDLRLLHLCGEHRRELETSRQSISPIVVYRSTPASSPDLSAAAGGVVLIHSPRAARRLAELVNDRASIAIAAISPAAGEAAGEGWERVEIAAKAADDALLALAAELCNNPSPE